MPSIQSPLQSYPASGPSPLQTPHSSSTALPSHSPAQSIISSLSQPQSAASVTVPAQVKHASSSALPPHTPAQSKPFSSNPEPVAIQSPLQSYPASGPLPLQTLHSSSTALPPQSPAQSNVFPSQSQTFSSLS